MSNPSFCPVCRARLPSDATLCEECGTHINKKAVGAVVRHKNPWLAAILSFFIPGLGQWYLRKWKRGAAWFLGSILLFILPAFTFYALSFEPTGPTELLLFVAFAIRGASAWDAKKQLIV
ncbi:MAG: hypothetical protein ABSF82_06385 [Candidatus Bathyarchaeia archaeon]